MNQIKKQHEYMRRRENERKYDKDRNEIYPPVLEDPYSLKKEPGPRWILMMGNLLIQNLSAQSEQGAVRESNLFIKNNLEL